jgi:hypothetical protein
MYFYTLNLFGTACIICNWSYNSSSKLCQNSNKSPRCVLFAIPYCFKYEDLIFQLKLYQSGQLLDLLLGVNRVYRWIYTYMIVKYPHLKDPAWNPTWAF